MLGFSLDTAKGLFFDTKEVRERLTKAERKVFGRVGANTRQAAKSSMKPASKRLLKQIAVLNRRIRRAKGPKRTALLAERKQLQQRLHSRPGQPPKKIKGQVSKLLVFALDIQAHAVVIGPTRLGSSNALPTLEEGGKIQIGPASVDVKARPFMGPAAVKQYPTFNALWRDAL